jgi:hypothetical protein
MSFRLRLSWWAGQTTAWLMHDGIVLIHATVWFIFGRLSLMGRLLSW